MHGYGTMNFIDTRIQPSVMFNAQLFLQPKCVPHTEHRMFRLRRTTIDRDCLGTSPCRGRDSSVGIATRYGLDGPGIESRWGEIFHTRSDRPWGPPSLLCSGYRVFPGGKAAGEWRWPPIPSSAEVEEGRVKLYICYSFGHSWCVLGWPLPLHLHYHSKPYILYWFLHLKYKYKI